MRKSKAASVAILYIAEIAFAADVTSISHFSNAAAGEDLAEHARRQSPWFDPQAPKIKLASGSSYRTRLPKRGWRLAANQEELASDMHAVFKVCCRVLFVFIVIRYFYVLRRLSFLSMTDS